MCGRYYRQSDKQKIAETFHVARWAPDVHLAPTNNIAPSTFQPIIRSSPEDGEREVVLMRWGLIPAKVADPDAFKIFSTLVCSASCFPGAKRKHGSGGLKQHDENIALERVPRHPRLRVSSGHACIRA